MPCHFYILFSETKNRFYTGATCDDLDERLRRHNANHKKGFTAKQNDWMIVYFETYTSKQQAFDREREVKGWKSRKKIINLISSQK